MRWCVYRKSNFLVSKNFSMNYDFKNGCKNEFKVNKSCCWSRKRVSQKSISTPYGRATAMPLALEQNGEISELAKIKIYDTNFSAALHLWHCELSTSKWRYRLPFWRHHVIFGAPNYVFWSLIYNLSGSIFQRHSKLFSEINNKRNAFWSWTWPSQWKNVVIKL